MATVLVERSFPKPVTFEEIQALEDTAAWCLELHDVTFKFSYFSLDKTRMVCVYDAPDAEAVRKSQETGKLPFDRVWSAELFTGTSSGDESAAK